MRIFKHSTSLLSKFKLKSVTQSLSFCSFKSLKFLQLRTFTFSFGSISSSNVTCLKHFSFNSGKIFQEVENEYAHGIMENLKDYSCSLLCSPIKPDFLLNSEKLYEQSNVFDEFAKVTNDNIVKGKTLENVMFSCLVKDICSSLPEASDGAVQRTLHYLCLWPPTSKTITPNFKALWNTLDKECVKRMKNWDKFHKKFSTMEKESNHLVFVYGTLKRGEPNHDVIAKFTDGSSVFKGKARTVKKWPLVIASRYNIPYLLYHEGKGEHVLGEIYEVDDIMLSKLDELECHPNYYTRLVEEVHLIAENSTNSTLIMPWIYFLKNFTATLLDLPFLAEYSSKGSHGLEYIDRYMRPSNVNYYSDVMDV